NLSRPRTFSNRPLQTKLMTHNGLFRPIPYLTAVSADEAAASQQPPLAQLHHYNGLFRPSSCLPVFSSGPELSEVDLTRPSTCLSLPSEGLYRPSSCLTMASLVRAPASLQEAQQASSPGHKIQAQNVHKSASEGLAPAFRWPLQAQLLPPGDFYMLCFYFWLCLEAQILPLSGLSSCQTPSSQPLQAELLLPASGLVRPGSFVTGNGLSKPSLASFCLTATF
ncbi:PREDICTED: putative uncharacterized protein encoded by LINC00174, partial [Mandrillus leucophaeus]|uniref:putative uncharacterized protein encoded by LINC00174 n=1 Tax=Mandrillus leucophaeus TaxID=9568 RepID=UPI0005F406F1